jgi:hypothetical protein
VITDIGLHVNFTFEHDNAIIRTPEMILIEADKAQVKRSHIHLCFMVKNRDVNAVKSTNTKFTD